MNIGSHLLSRRLGRSVLLVAALAVAVAFLFLGDGLVTKVVGALGALLVAAMFKVVSETFVQLKRLKRHMSQVADVLTESSTAIRSDLAKVVESHVRLEEVANQTVESLQEVQRTTANSESALSRLQIRFEEIEQQTHHQIEQIHNRIETVEKVSAETGAVLERLKSLSPDVRLLMGNRISQLPRSLEFDQSAQLLEWATQLGLNLESDVIEYLARKLLWIEASGVGRLAASTADGVFRALVAMSLSDESPAVLEIGVLFGINAAFLWDTVGLVVPGFHQTLIDPFEGYYGETLDRFTGLPVTREVTETNLTRMGAPPETWRILEGFSTDDWVLQAASERAYDMVFVDGDHSYEGVSFDVGHYGPLVKAGGVLLIDDYGAPGWPGVTQFIDEFRAGESDYNHVGTFNRTALFKRS